MKPSIKSLLSKLSPAIENGTFDVLIGDDASGRLPSLAIWDIMKKRYVENGYPPPKLFFFAGSRGLKGFALKKKIEDLQRAIHDLNKTRVDLNKKMLVITEYISAGDGMLPISKALTAEDRPYEIATLSINADVKDSLKLSQYLGAPVRVGNISGITSIYNQPQLAGVEKDPKDLYATRTAESYNQEYIQGARKDIAVLSSQLYEEYCEALTKEDPKNS